MKSKLLQSYSNYNRKNLTPAEAIIWKELKGKKLGVKFRRQQVIVKFIADFYAPSIGLVIEIDGGIHEDPTEEYNDMLRDDFMELRNLTIIRISNNEVFDQLELVIKRIKDEILKLSK